GALLSEDALNESLSNSDQRLSDEPAVEASFHRQPIMQWLWLDTNRRLLPIDYTSQLIPATHQSHRKRPSRTGPDHRVVDRSIEIQHRRINSQRVRRCPFARIEHRAVLVVLHDAAFYRDSEHIAC